MHRFFTNFIHSKTTNIIHFLIATSTILLFTYLILDLTIFFNEKRTIEESIKQQDFSSKMHSFHTDLNALEIEIYKYQSGYESNEFEVIIELFNATHAKLNELKDYFPFLSESQKNRIKTLDKILSDIENELSNFPFPKNNPQSIKKFTRSFSASNLILEELHKDIIQSNKNNMRDMTRWLEKNQYLLIPLLLIVIFLPLFLSFFRRIYTDKINHLEKGVFAFDKDSLVSDYIYPYDDEFAPVVSTYIEIATNIENYIEELNQTNENLEILNRELYESEERFMLAVEGINDGIWDWDIQTNRTYFSPRWKRMLGYEPEEIKNNYDAWVSLIHPKDKAQVLRKLENHLKGKSDFYEVEHRLKTSNGKYKWILARGKALFDKDGTPYRMAGSHTDITDRKEAELALEEEKERLLVTLRSIGDGVIATDKESRVQLMNKVAEDLTGWTQEESQGKLLPEIFHIIDEENKHIAENPVEKVLKKDSIITMSNHMLLIAKDGTERVIADSAAPIHDRESKIIGVVLAFRDVTEKRQIDEQLKRIQKLESIGILAGGIAHDFNNILTAILANLSLAKMSSDCDGEVLNILNDVERESLKAKHVTNQLLIFAKEEEPVKKMISIAELIKETTIFATRGTSIKCEFNIQENLWATEVDVAHINQVINNLAINAVQAMPDGGRIIVEAENTILESENSFRLSSGDYVKIKFRDEGVGIPKEIRQNIFVPFFSTKAKGSGLGLAVSHKIILNHDGYISVKSKEGKGAEFIIYLPARRDIKILGKNNTEKLPMGKGKILLMDDDETIRRATGTLLKRLGYDVQSVTDGRQAIEIYQEEKQAGTPFDVVIMDLTIPGGMGGVEAIQTLKKIDPDIKAVVSSGYSNDPVMSRYQEYGFVDIAKKPYKIDELIKVLNGIMQTN